MSVTFLTDKARPEQFAGAVAVAPIAAGELVAAFGGLGTATQLAVGEQGGNCARSGPTIVRAVRDIAPGEALTLDERDDVRPAGASRRFFAY